MSQYPVAFGPTSGAYAGEYSVQMPPCASQVAASVGDTFNEVGQKSSYLGAGYASASTTEKKTLRITTMPIMSAQRTNFGCCCVVVSIDAHYTTHETRIPCARRRDKVNQNSTQIGTGLGSGRKLLIRFSPFSSHSRILLLLGGRGTQAEKYILTKRLIIHTQNHESSGAEKARNNHSENNKSVPKNKRAPMRVEES